MNLYHPATEAEWHALRLRHVGSSEIPALFGCQPAYALSLWSLWMVKAGRAEPPPVEGNRVEAGKRFEPVIAQWVADREGWAIEKGGYASDGRGAGASLDYVIAGDPKEEGPGPLECKSVDWLQHRQTWTAAEPPPHILLQLQHQLAVTGYTWGAVGAVVGGNEPKVYRYKARPKLIAEIKRRVAEFWESVEAGIPPAVDGSDSAAAIIRQLFPDDDGAEEPADLSADNELPELCAGFLRARELRRDAERAEAAAQNAIMAKLGDHRAAQCEGFVIRAPTVPGKPDRIITAEDIGQVIKGRAGYRKLTVKEVA